MKSEQAAFAERLHRLLAEKKLEASPAELVPMLAKHGKVSVTQQTVSGWLNGKFMPRLRNQRALAAVLSIDLSTLLAEDKPRQIREASASWESGLSGKDLLAFQEYATLPVSHRKLIRELIAALAPETSRQRK